MGRAARPGLDISSLGSAVSNLEGLTSLKLDFRSCNQLRAGLRREFSSKDSFLAALGAGAGAPAMWMEVRAAQCSADFIRGTVTTLKKICRNI